MEELQSALGNRGLTVLKVPEKGRGLFATRDFSPGEVILNQEPYISVPNNFSGNSNCDVCFGSGYVNYCSGTCQMSEWNLHRIECEALSKLLKENQRAVTPSLRLMVRLYCRSYLQSQKTIPTSDMDNFSLVDALVSHMWDIDEKQVVLYSQMANLISLILQQPDVDILEITENFSKFACNAHTICDRELKPLGTGLYPVISIINHSCLPNSVLLFDGRSAVVRAVQHIPKGAEVLISYIDTTGSTLTRQKALKEQYLFTCACPRCSNSGQYEDIQESAVLEGYQCENTKCDGILLPNSANSKEAKIDMGSQLRSLQVRVVRVNRSIKKAVRVN